MQWSDIATAPPRKTLRQFAGLWIVFFAGLACWQGLILDRPLLGWIFAAMAATVGPLGLWQPQVVRPIFVAWMILVFPIGWTMSRLILAVLFYAVFTPVALIFRLIKRDGLARTLQPELETYWEPKPPVADPSRYLRPF